MRFKTRLNPKIWDRFQEKRIGGKVTYHLKSEVLAKLRQISKEFIAFLKIPHIAVKDIRITGSCVNYNYTRYSDLDLHIIVDYNLIHNKCPLVENYLWALKQIFNKDHDIKIYGIPVELYAENSKIEGVSNGVFSIKDNKWLKEPEKTKITVDDSAVKIKANEYIEAIDKCSDEESAQKLLDKIYVMRRSGLALAGEFSTENLVFKILRNAKVIEKLRKIIKKDLDAQLTLEALAFDVKERFNTISEMFVNKS